MNHFFRVPRSTAERTPYGEAGGLAWVCCNGYPYDARKPDLSDVLVARPRPFRLVIWEPLRTLAPSPARCSPHCCYISTVIFYARPYIKRQFHKPWRKHRGWGVCAPGSFEEYDKIESRLRFDDVVTFEGEHFELGGGRVRWARKRWWMVHSARRRQQSRIAA